MLEILIVIAPLFLVILLGAFLEHIKIADELWAEVLNNYALKIGIPALIFAALTSSSFVISDHLDLISANSIFLIVSFILAYIATKALKLNARNMRTLFITLAFGNVAYLGIPVLLQISGESILPVVSLIVAVYIFWMFTVGIGFLDYWQFGRKKDAFKIILLHLIKNPILIAVVLGLLVVGFDLSVPGILSKSISMVAASVTPVVLIVIGLFIGRSKFKSLRKWMPAFFFSITTLIILPALFYLGIQWTGASTSHFSASIIEAAMPLAITPFALADAYSLNKGFIARSIVLSTILSVITIPFWTSLV